MPRLHIHIKQPYGNGERDSLCKKICDMQCTLLGNMRIMPQSHKTNMPNLLWGGHISWWHIWCHSCDWCKFDDLLEGCTNLIVNSPSITVSWVSHGHVSVHLSLWSCQVGGLWWLKWQSWFLMSRLLCTRATYQTSYYSAILTHQYASLCDMS